MFSLLTQRTLSRWGSLSLNLNLGRLHLVATKPVLQTRRTLLTGTPRLSSVKTTAKETTAVKEPATKKKAAAQKPTATKAKSTAKPKKAVVKKRKVATKPKAPTRPKITKADLPPRQPGSAFVIFFGKYVKGLSPEHKPKRREDVSKLAKEAGATWRNFSEAEKQPFKDEAVVAREKYVIDRNNYFAKVSPSILSEINRRRQNKGKAIIQTHKAEADKRPLSPFFLYLADFRTSSPAADIKSSSPHGGAAIIEIAKQAAKNWREMSDSDKAPYITKGNEARAKYKAAHA